MDLSLSRALAPLVAIINHVMRRVDYLALYGAEVISQNDDGTLELKLADPKVAERVGPASRVPIKYGAPGYSARGVKKGARVLYGWEDGDARRHYAALWSDPSAVADVTLTATGGVELNAARVKLTAAGAQPVARQGDLVTLDTLPVGHPVRIIFIAPGGPIVPGTPYQAMLVIDSVLPMVGQISSGNPALEG